MFIRFISIINLPAFHTLAGCDTTTIEITEFGKNICWKSYDYDNLSEYTINCNILRRIMTSATPVSKLPPTKDALKLHCLRVHLQRNLPFKRIKEVFYQGHIFLI